MVIEGGMEEANTFVSLKQNKANVQLFVDSLKLIQKLQGG